MDEPAVEEAPTSERITEIPFEGGYGNLVYFPEPVLPLSNISGVNKYYAPSIELTDEIDPRDGNWKRLLKYPEYIFDWRVSPLREEVESLERLKKPYKEAISLNPVYRRLYLDKIERKFGFGSDILRNIRHQLRRNELNKENIKSSLRGFIDREQLLRKLNPTFFDLLGRGGYIDWDAQTKEGIRDDIEDDLAYEEDLIFPDARREDKGRQERIRQIKRSKEYLDELDL